MFYDICYHCCSSTKLVKFVDVLVSLQQSVNQYKLFDQIEYPNIIQKEKLIELNTKLLGPPKSVEIICTIPPISTLFKKF